MLNNLDYYYEIIAKNAEAKNTSLERETSLIEIAMLEKVNIPFELQSYFEEAKSYWLENSTSPEEMQSLKHEYRDLESRYSANSEVSIIGFLVNFVLSPEGSLSDPDDLYYSFSIFFGAYFRDNNPLYERYPIL